ncbi:MAG: DUF3369 domain-containing protein [Motiliproteus sp.]|nr:DUF3369 domain-containing protein [Motiliproteus sp.]MCW9053578.1 DUF3369 domain-containing protein [Motiliproteus sp.]
MSDVFVFAEDEEVSSEQGGTEELQGKWKVLIVDDDESVHQVTKLALKRVTLDDRPLEFISALSGEEAKQIAREHDDIALVLLDIVMENDHAGFDVANYIRHELNNNLTRIILRTGQPGDVPEKDVILNYEIDGYKTKSELTSQALFSVILTSLRSYRDLRRVEDSNDRLDKIVQASAEIFEQTSIRDFIDCLMQRMLELLPFDATKKDSFYFAGEIVEGSLGYLAGDDSLKLKQGEELSQHLPPELRGLIVEAQNKHQSVYRDGHLVLLGRSQSERVLLLYFADVAPLDDNLWHILNIFSRNFETAFTNLHLSIENENHRHNLEIRVEERTRQLSDTRDQLFQAEKLASIGQLAAGVAHEINNPLGFIKSNLAMFSDSFDQLMRLLDHYRTLQHTATEEQLNQLKQLMQDADLEYLREEIPTVVSETDEGVGRIRRIVSDLRDFASIETGTMVDVDLNSLLLKTLDELPPELREGIEIENDFGLLSPATLMKKQFGQALYNIISNAFEAMDGNEGKLQIVTREERDVAEVRLRDSGHGIDDDNLAKIFDPFFTTKDIGQGTGLGLSLSYGVIKLHGGTIDVNSVLGEGTEFVIRIPVQARGSLDSACL